MSFGIIRHYAHNFPLFSEKSTGNIIAIFVSFEVKKLSIIDHATNLFGQRSVLQANISIKLSFGLLIVTFMRPEGNDPGLFPQDLIH